MSRSGLEAPANYDGGTITPTGGLRWRAVVAAPVLVILGFVVNYWLVDGPDLVDSLFKVAFYGVLTSPVTLGVGLPVSAAVAWLLDVRHGRRGAAWLWVPSTLLASCLVADAIYEHLPSVRFRQYTNGPPPSTMSDLRMVKADSFGDGEAWTLAFRVAPADVPPILLRLHVAEVFPTADDDSSYPRPESIEPVDRLLQRDSGGLYARPIGARFFAAADHTIAVITATQDQVWVYRNFWSEGRQQ